MFRIQGLHRRSDDAGVLLVQYSVTSEQLLIRPPDPVPTNPSAFVEKLEGVFFPFVALCSVEGVNARLAEAFQVHVLGNKPAHGAFGHMKVPGHFAHGTLEVADNPAANRGF